MRELGAQWGRQGRLSPLCDTAVVCGSPTVAGKSGAGSPGDLRLGEDLTLYVWRTCRVFPDVNFSWISS